MKPVTKEEFFKRIINGALNVHPNPTGQYPYTTEWKYLDYGKYGQLFGKSVGRAATGGVVTDYFLTVH